MCAALAAPVHGQLVPIQGLPGVDTELGVDLLGMPLFQELRSDSPNALRLRASVSPVGAYDLTLERRLGDVATRLAPSLWVRATTLERHRFYGWGNDTPAPLPSSAYEFRPFEGSLHAGVRHERAGLAFELGPEFRYVRTGLDLDRGDVGEGEAP